MCGRFFPRWEVGVDGRTKAVGCAACEGRSLTVDCVIGTRPEAIKVLPLVGALRAQGIGARVIFTAQHTETLTGIFEAFGIFPDITLPSVPEGTLTARLSALLATLDSLPVPASSDGARHCVLVQGDTLTALAGGLWGFLGTLPVIHLEAGLRSHTPLEPYPEEAVRRTLAACSTLHLCPTPFAVQNLLREGVPRADLCLVGNTVADALRTLLPRVTPREKPAGVYRILLTLHRRECDAPTRRAMLRAVRELLDAYVACELVLPVHPSPAVAHDVHAILDTHPRAHLLPPLSPTDFYAYLLASDLVLTDSGGVQEEAALLGLDPLVLREVTEREDERYHGRLTLVGTDPARLLRAAALRLDTLFTTSPRDGAATRARALRALPVAAPRACAAIAARFAH